MQKIRSSNNKPLIAQVYFGSIFGKSCSNPISRKCDTLIFNIKKETMKKLILLSLLTSCLFSSNVFAQSKAEDIFKTYRFGLFMGPTFNSLKPTSSSIDNYNVEKVKGNVGFSFGITADYNINERYTMYSGLGLDWRGGTLNTYHDDTAIKSEYVRSANILYKQQYLTIPFGLKMVATKFDKVKIFAQTGFDLAFLLSQKGDYTIIKGDSSKTSESKTKVKLSGYANGVPINLGWTLGVGGEYDLNGSNTVVFTILYRNGFVDATSPKTNKSSYKFSDGNIRSNTIALRIGYFF